MGEEVDYEKTCEKLYLMLGAAVAYLKMRGLFEVFLMSIPKRYAYLEDAYREILEEVETQ